MKCNYSQKHKKKHIIRSEDLKEVNDYIEESFIQWLEFSRVSKNEFLAKAVIQPFEIHKTENKNGISVALFFGGLPFGEPIITSPDTSQNRHFKEKTAYLLMHMAQKLDTVNGGDYFCKVVKDFAKNELLVGYNI